ncbi:MAG: toluene tolerance protein [Rhodospirillaceae bacterium]|nr:toluene tolerance protein [Rhodospirillaceae bacterium]
MTPMRPILIPNPVFILVALVAMSVAIMQPARAADAPDDFIRTVGDNAIKSLTNKEISQQEREDRFRKILNDTFEIKLIARFTLGRFWRRASEEQQKEYTGLFEDFIVKAYAARFADYKGEDFVVGKVRSINDRDNLVQSEVVLTDGREIPVHWRVRNGKKLKIVDVLVEGVSMAITQRDEFSAIISQNGGKVDGLLAALRKKTGK